MQASSLKCSLGFLAAASACGASTVLAADPGYIAPPSSGIVGYVDIHGGFGAGSEDFTAGPFSGTDEWDSKNFGGAGRVAVPVDHFLLQFDAWFNTWFGSGTETAFFGSSDYDWSQNQGGVAAHLAWLLDGTMIGGLVSIGSDMSDYRIDGQYANTALEGMVDFENVRLYGQVGYTAAVAGDATSENVHAVYAHGVIGYYIDPNLVLSANLGVNQYTEDGGEEVFNNLLWGARVEKRFEGTPISAYLAYSGWGWDGSDPDETWNGTEHGIFAGVRVAFGDSSLQDLDHTVGLTDMNPIYGDMPH